MKEKKNGFRFVFLKAAFVDGYRVVKEMVNDSKAKNFPEKDEGDYFLNLFSNAV